MCAWRDRGRESAAGCANGRSPARCCHRRLRERAAGSRSSLPEPFQHPSHPAHRCVYDRSAALCRSRCVRGGIVDEKALLDALTGDHLLGAVIDAYEKEPLAADHPFRNLSNILLTPHIGASTTEAQRYVAVDVCVAGSWTRKRCWMR